MQVSEPLTCSNDQILQGGTEVVHFFRQLALMVGGVHDLAWHLDDSLDNMVLVGGMYLLLSSFLEIGIL